MITMEMAERMSGMFPPSLVSADDTETTTEPLFFVNAEGGMGHLARSAAVGRATFVPRHAAGQGLDRYTACEDVSHEIDHAWTSSTFDVSSGRLAEAVHRHLSCESLDGSLAAEVN
jgi:hypothetical protein